MMWTNCSYVLIYSTLQFSQCNYQYINQLLYSIIIKITILADKVYFITCTYFFITLEMINQFLHRSFIMSDIFQAEDSLETNPVNKISYIEVPPSSHSNPYATPVIKKPNPYATLNKRHSQLNVSNSFYSSVPVPVDYDHTDSQHLNHVSVSQTNTLKSTSKENLKRQYEIPWDRKIGDSFSTLNCSGSDLTMGYFANGRYYDPTPRQQTVTQDPNPEIYAPASSYSDRSNPPVFSTFTGGIARNQSTCSQTSSDSKYV